MKLNSSVLLRLTTSRSIVSDEYLLNSLRMARFDNDDADKGNVMSRKESATQS